MNLLIYLRVYIRRIQKFATFFFIYLKLFFIKLFSLELKKTPSKHLRTPNIFYKWNDAKKCSTKLKKKSDNSSDFEKLIGPNTFLHLIQMWCQMSEQRWKASGFRHTLLMSSIIPGYSIIVTLSRRSRT